MSELSTQTTVSVVDCGADDGPRLRALVEAVPETRLHMGPPSHNELLARARGARALVTLYTYTTLASELLTELPELELIATRTAGHSHIDVEAAGKLGVRVATVPAATTQSVVEYVFGALLAAQRRLIEARESTRAGSWDYQEFRGFELAGATLGVVGLGAIGTRVAEVGAALGMRALSWTRSGRGVAAAEPVALVRLLSEADVVVVCVALTEETRGLIGEAELAAMKPSAWLVNAARGGLLDEDALLTLLRAGRLGGAVLDVVDPEPPSGSRLAELAHVPNLLVTPHIAWHTDASLERQFGETTENVLAFLRGEERNLVPLQGER